MVSMQIFSGLAEGQVLQRLSARRGANVELTGGCDQTGEVLATISEATGVIRGWKGRSVGKAVRGKFSASLMDIPAGGPYRLELSIKGGKARAMVKDFLVGDVWILAGQSNMEGVGNREYAAKPHPLVRALSMRREWRLAKDNLHVLPESPDKCHNNGLQCTPREADQIRNKSLKGVGAGVFFGREMIERSGVPQGLICTAHGGTSMTQWSPADKKKGGETLYGSMLESWKITGQPVAGVLWYQGESDANPTDAKVYTKRMKSLVAATRRDLRQPNLPWFVVQIARVFGTGRSPEDIIAWNAIQEAQRLLPRSIKNLETVVAIDLELDDAIHIAGHEFPRLADRLARAADRLVYKAREKRPPQFEKILPAVADPNGSKLIDVEFSEVEGKLISDGEAQGFAMVDESGREIPLIFKTTLHGNKARLHLANVELAGLFLSYGHGVTPRCTIRDSRGLPLPVFGPQRIGKPVAYLPFVRQWRVSAIIPGATPLASIKLPEILAHPTEEKTYAPDGFINEHTNWQGKAGQSYFHTKINLPEPMRLDFLMGYDGPFRLWLDGKPFFANLDGTNPCIADESRQSASLKAGQHEITVAMDLQSGAAWGFFLRFERKNVTLAQIKGDEYSKPTYSA